MSLGRLVRSLCATMLVTALAAAPALAQTGDFATITVVHGVPGEGGFPADIYLNDQLVVASMVFEAVSDPVEVPAGEVAVALYAAGADPATQEAMLAQAVTLDAGASYTAVAQIVGDAPAIALYVNDLEPVDTGETRLTVRHTGAEGPLEIQLDGDTLVSDLMSPNEITVEVTSGVHPLVVASADGTPLVERDVDFQAGSLLVLYAVGSSDDFALLSQQVVTPQVTPTGVPTGSGGERAVAANAAWLLLPLAFVAAFVVMFRPRRSVG